MNAPTTHRSEQLCPKCGKPMQLARMLPALGDRPELDVYECPGCGESTAEHLREAAPVIDRDKWLLPG